MKNNKIINSLVAVVLSSLFLFSCYNDDRFLDNNLITTGKDFPVIASLSANVKSSAYTIHEVSAINDVTVSFWSLAPIKQLNVYETINYMGSETKELISSTPYSPNFVDSLRTDVFVFDYLPPQVEPQTNIDVEIEVENENGFTESRSFNMFYDVMISGNEKSYTTLDTVTFDYTYWSGTAIDAIDLVQYNKDDETKFLLQTVPVQPAFSGGFVLDTIKFEQLIAPIVVPADSIIMFEVQLIKNAQADTIKSSFIFSVKE